MRAARVPGQGCGRVTGRVRGVFFLRSPALGAPLSTSTSGTARIDTGPGRDFLGSSVSKPAGLVRSWCRNREKVRAEREGTGRMSDSSATGATRAFRFGVVAPLRTDLPTWRDRVRRIADSGYSTLLMPDVPQWQPAPGPTLALAAALADLRVGTWVYASPLRPPWITAWEAHSLSVLTDGRFEMGIGTGRPGIEDELRELGLPVVPPSERLAQVRETVDGAARSRRPEPSHACGHGRARSEGPGAGGRSRRYGHLRTVAG